MGRIETPRNERSRRTRAAILDAAWELLEGEGAEGTTLAAIAERAGVTRRALYLHFASRADLLLALHAHVDERLDLGGSTAAVSAAPNAVAALEEFAAHLARYHSRIARIDAVLIRAAGTDPDVARLVDQGESAWHAECRALAARLEREGALAAPWDTQTAADLLWSFMFPETLSRLTGPRGWSRERYGGLLALLLVRTLTTTGPMGDPGRPSGD